MFEKLRQNLKEWGVNWECFLILHDEEEVLARSDKNVLVLINGLFPQILCCFALKRRIGWNALRLMGSFRNSQPYGIDMRGGNFYFVADVWDIITVEEKNAVLLPKVSTAMYSSHGVKKSSLYWFYVYSIL